MSSFLSFFLSIVFFLSLFPSFVLHLILFSLFLFSLFSLFVSLSFFSFFFSFLIFFFLVADTQLYKRLRPSVGPFAGRSVMVIELETVKTRISAPAHPSATGIGRVSGLVIVASPRLKMKIRWKLTKTIKSPDSQSIRCLSSNQLFRVFCQFTDVIEPKIMTHAFFFHPQGLGTGNIHDCCPRHFHLRF